MVQTKTVDGPLRRGQLTIIGSLLFVVAMLIAHRALLYVRSVRALGAAGGESAPQKD